MTVEGSSFELFDAGFGLASPNTRGAEDTAQLMRQNSDPFFSLIEHAPFGLYVLDAQLRMKQASIASQKVFANIYPLIGRDFEEILRLVWADPFASEALGRFRHTLKTGEPFSSPDTSEQRQNIPGVESYDWKIERITLPDGQLGVVCYFYDVTERKHAEDALRESEAFSRSTLQSSPDCVKVLDLSGVLLSMPSGQPLLGITDIESFRNKSWIEFWHGEHRVAAQAAVGLAAAGGVGHFTGSFVTMAGVPKWWDVLISPILDANGKPARLLAVARDITQCKQAEINLAFLASVSRDLLQSTSVGDMIQTVGARLGAHLQLSICAFAEINETAEQVVIKHDWHRDDALSLVGVYRLADFVEKEFICIARADETIVVRNTADDPRTDHLKFAALNIASFICVPLIDNGQWRFALCLYHRASYDWREDEIELARELTARIWTRLRSLRAEQALIESENRYRSVLFSTLNAIFVCDRDATIQQYNPVAAELWGREPHRGIERLCGSFKLWNLDGTQLSHEYCPIVEVLRTGFPVLRAEAVIERPDGTQLPVLINIAALKNVQGEITGAILSFVDISSRHHAEEELRCSKERFRALFDWGPLALYTVDATGALDQFNRRAVELWGREPQRGPDGTLNGTVSFYLPDGSPLTHAETPVAAVLSGEMLVAHDMELVMERPDGSRVTVMANVVPIKDRQGRITGAMIGLYDVTERSQLNRKLTAQAEALLATERRKDEFVAMLGHELRNPLAPIANAVQMLRLQQNEGVVQRQARVVIERQVAQLQHLVDDLLEVSRINSGRVRLRAQRIAIDSVVEKAVQAMQPLIAQHRHAFSVTMPPKPIYLYADSVRLEQVLVNLLSNAIKYTDPGGRIALTVALEGDAMALRVFDNGIGMASDLLPHVFGLFTQAERSLDRSQGGLGIGLCLVQRLVEMHGGSVQVHSVPSQGSEFLVRLPVLQPGSNASTDRAPSEAAEVLEKSEGHALMPGLPDLPLDRRRLAPHQQAETSCRVMVVDDNIDAAQTVAILLVMSGHQVMVAHGGEGVLEAALAWLPEMLLLDIGLPGISGLDVARRIRQQPLLDKTRLVALTGYGLATDRQRSHAAGFDHHLVKPTGFDEIEKILVQVCQSRDHHPAPAQGLTR